MSQALGFAPAEYARAQEINQDLKRIDRTVNTKRTKLMKQYYIAFRMHDWAQLDNIKDEIAEFNKRHRRSPKVVISEESIKKSMKMHMKTTETMYNGVTLSPNMRDTLLEIARAYERGPNF
jgi:phage terminase large subunit-like protein